jgi:hypothetical protein
VERRREHGAGGPEPAGYPIPVEARTQPHWIEGGYPGNCDWSYAGSPYRGDKHMLIVDADHRLLFETWNTRNPQAPLGGPLIAANGSRTFALVGACGIPATAKAVSANLAVVNPSASGDLVVFPAGIGTPNASTLSFAAGGTRANNTQILVSADGTGRAKIQNNSRGALDLLIDVIGYYE